MSSPAYVANSSPLIVFERVGRLDLLPSLMNHLFVPSAVRREVFGANALPAWLTEKNLTQPAAARIASARLGAGEREAIALALEMSATELVIDDLAARRLAQSLGLSIIGSLGLLIRAKNAGLISAVRPLMLAMQSDEFHIAENLFEGILKAAGELS